MLVPQDRCIYKYIMPHFKAAAAMTNDCLCFRARRLSRVVTRLYDDALRPVGLQATQLTLLNAIAMGGAKGNLMPRIAEVLAMDATTLSRNLKPLEREALIVVERLPSDKRVRVAKLTPAGESKLIEALPIWQKAHDEVVALLGADAAGDLRNRLDAAAMAADRAMG